MRHLCVYVLCTTLAACIQYSENELPVLDIRVKGDNDVIRAMIEIYAVDSHTGEILYDRVLGSAMSDQNGRASIKVDEYHELLIAVARGGYTFEYWAPDTVINLNESGHLIALVPYYKTDHATGNRRPVSMNPVTTDIYNLARARYKHNRDDSFIEAVELSQELLYHHFIGYPVLDHLCEADLTCLEPSEDYGSEGWKYSILLRARASLAHEQAIDRTYHVKHKNSISISYDLSLDVDEDGFFNGYEPEGLPENSLRSDIGNAFIKNYIKSNANDTGISIEEVRYLFERMAQNMEYELFKDTPIDSLDF